MWANMAKQDDDGLELFKLKESHKTARLLICGAVLVLAVWIIADAAVKISAQPDRWVWLKIAVTIAAAFIPAGALIYRWIGKLKMQIRRHAGRVTSLELSVDVNRESSGANQDGTHRYDGL